MTKMKTIMHKVGRAIVWLSVLRCLNTGCRDTNKYIEEWYTCERHFNGEFHRGMG